MSGSDGQGDGALAPLLFARFQQELRRQGYARQTIQTYSSALRAYVRWLGEADPRDASAEQVRAFLLHLVDEGHSRSWLGQAIAALRLLYHELYGRSDVAFDVPLPKRGVPRSPVPTRQQILAVASAASGRTHRLAILLLYGSGLRVSELCALNVGDVDLERRVLHVRSHTGSPDRQTLLSARLRADLRWAMGTRDADAPLLLSQAGGRWSVRSVQRVVRRAAESAGVKGQVTPRTLRQAFAAHLLEGGTDLWVVQTLLGHTVVRRPRRLHDLADPHGLAVRSPLD